MKKLNGVIMCLSQFYFLTYFSNIVIMQTSEVYFVYENLISMDLYVKVGSYILLVVQKCSEEQN
jgi:hypothetical protein